MTQRTGRAHLLLLLLFTTITSANTTQQKLVKNAQRYRPSETDKALILKEIQSKEEHFNPEISMLRVYRSKTSNRYHSTLVGQWVYPLRRTAAYAVDLLATDQPVYQQRAFKIIDALIACQDQDPQRRTYGIWPYHFTEPLDAMNKPDWNWADFIGVQLLEAYLKHHDVLPDELREKMRASIIHASRSIQKRDVKPTYTNIAIMGTLVTHLCAHLFDIADLKAYADMRMKRFYDYTKELGGFVEYNSPTYTRVALDELMRMKQYILDPPTLAMVDYCYRVGWEVLASHFHPPTGQLAAPHSRSYSTLMRSGFYDILFGASAGRIKYGPARKPTDYYKLQHAIPEDLIPRFQRIDQARVEVDTFSLGSNPVIGTTYLTPTYCLGTVNRSTTWQQRRPYLAYWGDAENPRYLRVRLLHDFEDFGIGNIFSVQNQNQVLTAMNVATNGGDYHISIDRIKNGTFKARDVRLRFEMADAGLLGKLPQNDSGFVIQESPLRIQVDMLHSVFGDFKIRTAPGKDDRTCWLDYIIYTGAERDFDLTKVDQACFAWQTTIAPKSHSIERAKKTIANKRIHLQLGDMKLSIPMNPALENEQQKAFIATVPKG